MFQTDTWPNRVVLIMCLKTGKGRNSATITHTHTKRESVRDVTLPEQRHKFCG